MQMTASRITRRLELCLCATCAAVALGSCSNKQSLAISCASTMTCESAPTADAGVAADGGAATLASFTPPTDPGPGGILFAASGEVLALTGYPFPPANPGDPAFVDGWDVHFSRLLVTIDNITLSDGPNVRPGDESCTEPTVAKVSGPWAVDLAHSDPSYLPGKGGPGEQAVPIAALAHQNYPPGNSAAFDTSGATPYAFGFDMVPATTSAMNVNLDAAGLTAYAQMLADGCSILYVGTAKFQGTSCTCPTASAPNAPCDPSIYGAAKWPQVGDSVPFHLCFRSPTTLVNCQNPDNDPAQPLAGEEHERGILFKSTSSVIGQVTIHTDHPFWDSVLHDSPAHFDQFAARVAGMGPTGQNVSYPTATLEMTKGVDYAAYRDAVGNALNWRYCIAPPTDVHPQFVGAMAFDPQSIPRAAGSDACQGLRDYYDFATYNQSTQGHLNSDGLCYVARHYPAPK
jgi:hypothetical protein